MARLGTSTRARKMVFQSPPPPPPGRPKHFFAEYSLIVSGGTQNFGMRFLHPFLLETGNTELHFLKSWQRSTLARIRTLNFQILHSLKRREQVYALDTPVRASLNRNGALGPTSPAHHLSASYYTHTAGFLVPIRCDLLRPIKACLAISAKRNVLTPASCAIAQC